MTKALMMMRFLVLTVCLLLPLDARACSTDGSRPCTLAEGAYRIVLPDGVAHPGAMVWLHGLGGSAEAAMRNTAFRRAAAARGLAFVAPDGQIPAEDARRNWAVRDGQVHPRDDIGFLEAVIRDLEQRHNIDRSRILLAGFSRGGSMVWDVACRSPGLARAYASVAGAFWEPMPTACTAPVDMFHTHGWSDRTVPLEGRVLRNGALTQGDVFHSLFVLRAANGCTNRQPVEAPAVDGQGRWQRVWSDCTGGRIDLLLHPGGHSVPAGWLARTLDWFEARLDESCETRQAETRQAGSPQAGSPQAETRQSETRHAETLPPDRCG